MFSYICYDTNLYIFFYLTETFFKKNKTKTTYSLFLRFINLNLDYLKRKFLTNLILLIFLNLLVKPFWIFGIDRTIQNTIGTEQYGFYFSLFNFSLILNILLDVGITNFNNRNISQNNQLATKHFSNIIILKVLLSIIYFIISLIAAYFIGYDWSQIQLLIFLLFNQFLLSFILYLRSNISALQYFTIDSLVSVLDRVLMIIIIGVLLWGNITDKPFQIEWFVYGQTAAYLLTAFIVFIIVLSKLEFKRLHFDWTFFVVFIKQSYPYALLILLMTFYYRIDSVMIERLLPDGKIQAGIYAQSFRILDAISMFAFLFASLLLPMFSRMIKQKQSVNELIQLALMLILTPAIIIAVSSYFFKTDIISLLYHDTPYASSVVFSILMFSFIFISISYIYGTLLTANGSMKALNIMAAGGMIINITLNFILIPVYKAPGAAAASLITQILTAMAQVVIAKKIFHFNINLSKVILFAVFTIVTAFVSYWIYNNISDKTGAYFILIISTMILAMFLKLIDIQKLILILKNNEE